MSEGDHILSFRRAERASKSTTSPDAGSPSSETNRSAGLSSERGGEDRVLSMINHGDAEPFSWKDLQHDQAAVPVQIRLGAARLAARVQQTTAPGTIVALDARVDDPVEVVVSGRVIAYGRLVVAHGKLAVEVCRVDKEVRRQVA